jgi:hypothetical protein
MPGRKLFLTHASELAHLLVTAITRDAMAMKFVRAYAERHDRRKVVSNVERLREMERTISREALLLIAAEVRRLLPRAFGFSGNPRPEDRALCDAFYAEFLEALGRALEWPFVEVETEGEAFRKDLEVYVGWRERNPTIPVLRKPRDESPFPDRCAILLDSAMMDQARRAAAAFQSDLLRLGTRLFGQLGRLAPQRRISAGTRVRPARLVGRGRRNGNRGVRLRKPAKRSARPRRRS